MILLRYSFSVLFTVILLMNNGLRPNLKKIKLEKQNNQLALGTIFLRDKADLSEAEYDVFINELFPLLISPGDFLKISSSFTPDMKMGLTGMRNPKLEELGNSERLLNLWTFKRAKMLFSIMRSFREAMNPDVWKEEKLREKYKVPEWTKKDIIAIGDVHGNLFQMILPLIGEGICRPTGKLVFYDTLNRRRLDNKRNFRTLHSFARFGVLYRSKI